MVKALTKFVLAAVAAFLPSFMWAQSMTVHVKGGDPVTLQTNQIESITFTDDLSSVYVAPKIGDFYYSDGTWSSEFDYSKDAIGIVFYVGDPTAEDPILKADHPDCTHGLVVAAHAAETGCVWQNTYIKSVGEWITANLPGYTSTESNYGQDEIRNSILGYNNTKAILAFNKSNPDYTVVPVEKVSDFETEHPAPAASSGWYVPSVKELFLLINGEMDNPELLLSTKTHANISVIDNALAYIIGAKLMYNSQWAYDIWSSNEFGYNAYAVCTYDGAVEGIYKDSGNNTLPRFVLAF